MGRDRGTQMGRGAGGRDFGRVTGGYSGGGNPGRGSPEVRLEAMDMGLLEAAVSEAHPAQAEGHPWLEVPEVEDLMVRGFGGGRSGGSPR